MAVRNVKQKHGICEWQGISVCYYHLLNIKYICLCTINSKINGTSKGVNFPISKLHLILAVANSLAHNNLWFCYYGQVNTFGGTIYFAGHGSYITVCSEVSSV